MSVSCPFQLRLLLRNLRLAASADSARVDVGTRLPPPPPPLGRGVRFSTRARRHQHPHRQPVEQHRTCSPAPPSPPKPAAAGNRSTSTPRGCAGTTRGGGPPTATTHSTQLLHHQPTATAPSRAPAAGNGVFHYGASGNFPADSYQASNYWVDVVFTTPGARRHHPTHDHQHQPQRRRNQPFRHRHLQRSARPQHHHRQQHRPAPHQLRRALSQPRSPGTRSPGAQP